ncbi:MAG: BolA family protein [Granulosicoccus sp.]
MTIAEQINDIIVESLSPIRLDVINESHQHNVPKGSESHFKLVVISDEFIGKNLIARHRSVNKLLADLLKNEIHALSMHTHTPQEWLEKGETVPESPPCMGGKARES